MSRSSLALTVAFAASAALAAAGSGCSHDEPPPPARPTVAQAPAPPPKPARRAPPPPPPEVAKPKEDLAVFFDFDSSLLKDDGRRVLQTVADAVRKENASLKIEGHCDELGTTEYNLSLGEERARAAKEYLVRLGVPAQRISTVSYGSQRPKYTGHDDDTHAKNRRDDFIVGR